MKFHISAGCEVADIVLRQRFENEPKSNFFTDSCVVTLFKRTASGQDEKLNSVKTPQFMTATIDKLQSSFHKN